MLNLEVHAALVKQGAELLVKTPGQRVRGYINYYIIQWLNFGEI